MTGENLQQSEMAMKMKVGGGGLGHLDVGGMRQHHQVEEEKVKYKDCWYKLVAVRSNISFTTEVQYQSVHSDYVLQRMER